MDIDLARKLLGVDGSNLLTLETAWHDRRTQILQQRELTSNEAEILEYEALLANLDRARQVLQEAAAAADEDTVYSDSSGRPLPVVATAAGIGVAAGLAIAAAIIALIAALTGHLP